MRSKDSSNSKTKTNSATGNTSDIQYSENWSGAAITSPPSGQTFNAVSGKFTVPTPSAPSGVSATDGEYSASAWVGIDGNTYSTAILQTGVDFTVSTSGIQTMLTILISPSQLAMSVIPLSMFRLPSFEANICSQVISMYVNATTSTTGSATVENLTTGKTVTKSLTSTSALGGENAEWIVEDYEEGDSLIAFADFGNVTFTDCVAATSESSEGVDSATIMDIENTDNEVLTDVTLINDSSFEVSYTSSGSSSTTTGSSGRGSSGGGFGSGSDSGNGGQGGEFGNSQTGQSGNGGFGQFKRSMNSLLWGRPSTSGGL
jgi:hypothetical protein